MGEELWTEGPERVSGVPTPSERTKLSLNFGDGSKADSDTQLCVQCFQRKNMRLFYTGDIAHETCVDCRDQEGE